MFSCDATDLEATQVASQYNALHLEPPEPRADHEGDSVTRDDADEISAEDEATMLKVAQALRAKVACRAAPNWDDLAEALRVSVKTLRSRLQALAEAALQNQAHVQEALVNYIMRLHAAKKTQPVLYLEHIIFDETPLLTSLSYGDSEVGEHVERARLFVIERGYTLLMCSHDDSSKSSDEDAAKTGDQYFCVTGQLSKTLKAAERCTGEGIAAVLRAAREVPAAATQFKHCIHMCECDELPANGRAEGILGQERGSAWVTFASFCVAHKIHAACEKLWSLPRMRPIVSGALHVGLLLQSAAARLALHEALAAEVASRRLVISTTTVPSEESSSYRRRMVALFSPCALDFPDRHSLLTVISSELLNGDWKCHELHHHCGSATCCRDEQHARSKIMAAVRQMLRACPIRLLQRNNWRDWMSGFRGLAILEATHGLLSGAFARAFGSADGIDMEQALAAPPQQDRADVVDAQEADPTAVDYERLRKERLEHQAAALRFLNAPGWLDDTVVLCRCLAPEVQLMRSFLASTSAVKECGWQNELISSSRRPFRVEELHYGVGLLEMQQHSLLNFTDSSLWTEMADTEEFRSSLLVAALRPASVIYELISTRYKNYPYKLFSLLGRPSREQAREILSSPHCMQDELTRHILREYPTEEMLTSQEALQVLSCLAQRLMTTSFSTERAHASNARRKRAAAHTKHKSISALAIADTAVATPFWSRAGKELSMQRKVPKVAKRHRKRSGTSIEVGSKNQKKGGGGPWRAYVHDMIVNKGAPRDFRLLCQEYQRLTEDEKLWYRSLGRAGVDKTSNPQQ